MVACSRIALLFFWGVAAGCLAAESGDCEARYAAREYGRAFVLCIDAAERGHAMAQYNLAQMYRAGDGVERDAKQAHRWYEVAASQGGIAAAAASVGLAEMYYGGDGVERDYGLARHHLEQAVRMAGQHSDFLAGHYYSSLAMMYRYGIGAERNAAVARRWMERAVARQLRYSHQILARMYYTGEGGRRDYDKAFKLLRECLVLNGCIAGHILDEDMHLFGRMHELGRGAPRDYSVAAEWYGRASANGHARSLRRLGLLYHSGLGVAQDSVLARDLLSGAARAGCAPAMTDLAQQYLQDSPTDAKSAIRKLERAMSMGDLQAWPELRRLYEDGMGVGVALQYVGGSQSPSAGRELIIGLLHEELRDYSSALRHYRMSLELHGSELSRGSGAGFWADLRRAIAEVVSGVLLHPEEAPAPGALNMASMTLAEMHRQGNWRDLAGSHRPRSAEYLIGRLYHLGLGVQRDIGEALIWYQLAAPASKDAATALSIMYRDGDGVKSDAQLAYKWARMAVLLGGGADDMADNIGANLDATAREHAESSAIAMIYAPVLDEAMALLLSSGLPLADLGRFAYYTPTEFH